MKKISCLFLMLLSFTLFGCSDIKNDNENSSNEEEVNKISLQPLYPDDITSREYRCFKYSNLGTSKTLVFTLYTIVDEKWVQTILVEDSMLEGGYIYFLYESPELLYGYTDSYDGETIHYSEKVYDENIVVTSIATENLAGAGLEVKQGVETGLFLNYTNYTEGFGTSIDTTSPALAEQGIYLTITFR
ncbi:MAG: hypothetical protein R3Y05_03450 [bacterium]